MRNTLMSHGVCFTLLLLSVGSSAQAAAPVKVQSAELNFNATGSGSVKLAHPVSSGNLLTVQIAEWDANGTNRTAAVSDNLGNVYTRAARQVGSTASGGNCVEEWYAKNVTGGTVTVTVNYGANTSFDVLVKELGGADPAAPLDQAGSFDEAAKNLTQHDCAPAAGITTAASVYVSATSALSGSGGTISPVAGYSFLTGVSVRIVHLEAASVASLAGTRGQFNSSVACGACGCLVSYKAPPAGAGGSNVAPKQVQSAQASYSASSISVKLPQTVASGDLLTVQIAQWDGNGANRTAGVSDNVGNKYQRAVRQVGSKTTGGNCVEEWYATNVTGGTVTVTVNYGTGLAAAVDVLVKELSGADSAAPLDQAAAFDEGANNLTQHDCAPAGGVTTASNVYISGSSALNSAGGTITPGAGYLQLAALNNRIVFLEESSAAAVSGTRGDYKSSYARGGCGCLVSYKAPAAAPPAPQILYVATNGSDSNPGTLAQPLLTIAAALRKLPTGGAIYLRAGTYPTTATLSITVAGAQILAMPGETVTVTHGANYQGELFGVWAASVRIQGLILDGQFATNARAILARPAANLLTVSNCEVKQFTRHAVDISGADCTVDSCHIHHCLWWDPTTGIQDAHGVTTGNAQRLLIKNCTIHQVSGDSFQGDRGSWQDITVDGCTFYDAPLEADMAGFKQGQYCSENAIDTKHLSTAPRARLTVKNSKMYGFNSSFIGNDSAFNLKEQVEVVVDSCEVYNTVIAFRLRGLTGNTGCWPTIFNCTIHDADYAIRYEDDLMNLHLAFNTVHNCGTLFLPAPSSTTWGPGNGWIVQNNLFVGASALPREAPAPLNVIPPPGSVDTTTLEPTTATGLLGTPVPANTVPFWYPPITKDKAGVVRSTTTPTMGAYEFVPGP